MNSTAQTAGYIVTANDRIFGAGSTPEQAQADAVTWLEPQDNRGDEEISLLDGCSVYPATPALLAQVQQGGTPEQWGRLPGPVFDEAAGGWVRVHCTLAEQEAAEEAAAEQAQSDRDTLADAGRALYGAEWVSPLARGLGVALRTVQRWAAGEVPVPERVLQSEIPQLARRAVEEGLPAQLEARAASVRQLAGAPDGPG